MRVKGENVARNDHMLNDHTKWEGESNGENVKNHCNSFK